MVSKYKKIKMKSLNTDRLTGYPHITGLKSVTDIACSSLNAGSYFMVNLIISDLDNMRDFFGYAEANKVQEDL